MACMDVFVDISKDFVLKDVKFDERRFWLFVDPWKHLFWINASEGPSLNIRSKLDS